MAKISEITRSKTFYLIISILAAILLWFYVTSYENTTQELTLSGLEVAYEGGEDLLQDRDLIVTDRDMQEVSLTLLVKRSLLSKLNVDTVKVSVDLRDIRRVGVYEKVYTITYPEGIDEDEIIVTRKSPEFMTVNIDKMVSKTVEIRGVFDGTVATGYMREPIVYEPDTVTVSGPESLVNEISYAGVVVDRENLTKTVAGTVTFTLMNDSGEEIRDEDVTTDVGAVSYTIPIVMVKDVGLAVNLLSGGGATEADAIVDINPPTVTLSGSAELLEPINQLTVGTIDLSEFATSVTKTFTILIPNDVSSLSGEKEAEVTVTVRGLATKRVLTTNISFINVSDGYTATSITQYKEVILRGPQEIIDLIDGTNVRIVGDLTDIGNAVGRYSVPTTVYVDGYQEAGVIGNSYNVVVSLEEIAEEAETPEGAT